MKAKKKEEDEKKIAINSINYITCVSGPLWCMAFTSLNW